MVQASATIGRSSMLLLVLSVLTGCPDNANNAARAPNADEIPTFVSINPGKVTLGLALAVAQEDREVPAFRITKHPITVRRYRQCMAAGSCDVPALSARECRPAIERVDPVAATGLSGSTIEQINPDEFPVTCLKPEQAARYCSWIGGKLPDSTQWLAAARGPTIRRYAWGNSITACEQHPLARVRGLECAATDIERFHVGSHPMGTSPMGIEDVLLTPAELVATSTDAWASVCRIPSPGCLVTGMPAGAIDGFSQITAPSTPDAGMPTTTLFGFRCAMEGT